MVLATAKPTLDVEMAVARTASPRVTDLVPILQLQVFRALLTDEEDNHLDIDNGVLPPTSVRRNLSIPRGLKNSTSQVLLSAGHSSNILQSSQSGSPL